MVKLTKISGEVIVINCSHIELIEIIPESKVVMNSGLFYIVRESVDEIISRVVEFKARILAFEKNVISKDNRDI